MTTPVYDPNYLGAAFSFLRVLAVALASALLPMFVGAEEYPTGKAVGIACGAAFLLTVVNYFRDGETRFGTPPNLGAPAVAEDRERQLRPRGDGGYTSYTGLGSPLLIVGLLLILVGAIVHVGGLMIAGVVAAVVGLALLLAS